MLLCSDVGISFAWSVCSGLPVYVYACLVCNKSQHTAFRWTVAVLRAQEILCLSTCVRQPTAFAKMLVFAALCKANERKDNVFEKANSLLDADGQITATNFNVVLGTHKGLFSLHFCMTSLVGTIITFYVVFRQSYICCFRHMTLLPLQWVWN